MREYQAAIIQCRSRVKFHVGSSTLKDQLINMVPALSLLAPYQHNRRHRTDSDHLSIQYINRVAAIHRDADRPLPDPLIRFFSVP